MIGDISKLTSSERSQVIMIMSSTISYEGGYVNKVNDRGGETYCGISRKYHPDWKGWAIIDVEKRRKKLKWNEIISNQKLTQSVFLFYFNNYFKQTCGKMNLSPSTVPLIAVLFDYAVHSGISRAVRKLQTVINSFGQSILVDGDFGKKTLKALDSIGDYKKVATALLDERIKFLKSIGTGKNAEFLQGWLNRCQRLRKEYKL